MITPTGTEQSNWEKKRLVRIAARHADALQLDQSRGALWRLVEHKDAQNFPKGRL